MANKDKRETNIELLRIVLMVAIVLSHVLIHGYHSFSYPSFQIGNSVFLYLTTLCLLFPVDCFIFISGYYGIRLKGYKVVSFVFQVFFYSIITFSLGYFLLGTSTRHDLLKHVFPISNSLYWFFTNYFLLMLISPFLNIGCDNMSKKRLLSIIIVMYIICVSLLQIVNRGWSPFACFLFIYLLGRYLNRFPINLLEKHSVFIFIITILLQLSLGGIGVLLNQSTAITSRLYLYSSPLNIILAASCFYMFKQKKIQHNLYINYISSGVFAAYLFSDSLPIRKWINAYVCSVYSCNNDFTLLFMLVILSCLLVIVTSFLERQFFSVIRKPLTDAFYQSIRRTIKIVS